MLKRLSIRRGILRLTPLVPTKVVRTLNEWQFSRSAFRRGIARGVAHWLSRAPARIARGVGEGLFFDPDSLNPGYVLGTTEPAVQEAVAAHLSAGDTFYDVGACVGFFSLLGARLVGEGGVVVAFEPLPRNAAVVRRNVELNALENVNVLEVAASDSTGERALGVRRRDSSTLVSLEAEDETMPVKTVAIDDLVLTGQLPPPSVVKLDVEGAELDVLSGMLRTIETHRPTLVIEVHWLGSTFSDFARQWLPGYDLTVIDSDRELSDVAHVHVLATPNRLAGAAERSASA